MWYLVDQKIFLKVGMNESAVVREEKRTPPVKFKEGETDVRWRERD